jgi:hypothetical protein
MRFWEEIQLQAMAGNSLPPLLRIPSEIRLLIYDLLLNGHNNKIFSIRTEQVENYAARVKHLRTDYRILGGQFRRESQLTTYRCASGSIIHPEILSVNRQIYEEASHVLYARHMFDFGSDVEAIVPFLSDLTPSTLSLIREIGLTKRPSVYDTEFDRCEWCKACGFVAQHLQLQRFTLSVRGCTRELPLEWEGVGQYTAADFKTLASVGFEGLEWVRELVQIRPIQELEIIPLFEFCPLPASSGMRNFILAFSASVETGFADYLRKHMLAE